MISELEFPVRLNLPLNPFIANLACSVLDHRLYRNSSRSVPCHDQRFDSCLTQVHNCPLNCFLGFPCEPVARGLRPQAQVSGTVTLPSKCQLAEPGGSVAADLSSSSTT